MSPLYVEEYYERKLSTKLKEMLCYIVIWMDVLLCDYDDTRVVMKWHEKMHCTD